MTSLTLAEVIKNRRKELGISLAELSFTTNLHANYIKRIEDNRAPYPSWETIALLLLGLKIKPDSISEFSSEEIQNIEKEYNLLDKTTENSNEDILKVATLIKNKRKELGFSLKDLENITGISASYINRLENGNRTSPSLETIKKIALALNLDTEELSGITKEQINSENYSTLIDILKKGNISHNGTPLSMPVRNKLCILIDYVLNCKWSYESKISDIKVILDLVENLKQN